MPTQRKCRRDSSRHRPIAASTAPAAMVTARDVTAEAVTAKTAATATTETR